MNFTICNRERPYQNRLENLTDFGVVYYLWIIHNKGTTKNQTKGENKWKTQTIMWTMQWQKE